MGTEYRDRALGFEDREVDAVVGRAGRPHGCGGTADRAVIGGAHIDRTIAKQARTMALEFGGSGNGAARRTQVA